MQTSPESRTDRITVIAVRAAVVLSVFAVLTHWHFWDIGPMAFGMNAAVFASGILTLQLWVMKHRGVNLRLILPWTVPLYVIAVGAFLLYENPFLKAVSVLVLPVCAAVFLNAAMREQGMRAFWGEGTVLRLAGRALSPVAYVAEAVRRIVAVLFPVDGKASLAKRVTAGTAIFLVIAVGIVLPLLGGADPAFAELTDTFLQWVADLIEPSVAGKILAAIVLTVVLIAVMLGWLRPFSQEDKGEAAADADSVITGIVIGGMLLLYAAFLWIQAGRLLVGELPFDFAAAVYAVKSGFWQLVVLTLLNITVFVSAYRRTAGPVQRLLLAFAVASLLLLASAGQRMALYVINYGFSYEKFFASYTVLYCAIFLGWLVWHAVKERRADVTRFGASLFLWMFAALTVFPVEWSILRANLALAKRPDTRIRLVEMQMLSPDVLARVQWLIESGQLEEPDDSDIRRYGRSFTAPDWSSWIENSAARLDAKPWYERTVSGMINGALR